MGRIFIIFIFCFTCLSHLNAFTGFQEDELLRLLPPPFQWDLSRFAQSQPRLIQPKLIQRDIAQSQTDSNQKGFEEPGEYAVFPPSAARRGRRFGFRVFGGFNFAWNIRSRYYNSFNPSPYASGSSEYIFPHTSLLGSLSFGGSFFFLITQEIGAMFSASYEIESKVEQYRYERFNDTSPSRRGLCGISSRDENYDLCALQDQFSYSIISLELSTFYKVLPSLYLFAGPNFFIPVGFKMHPRDARGGSQFPVEIKGHLGGQVGVGFVFYQKFFVEGLFKTQNFILDGIRLNSSERPGIFETGRLWGFMVRGGLQF